MHSERSALIFFISLLFLLGSVFLFALDERTLTPPASPTPLTGGATALFSSLLGEVPNRAEGLSTETNCTPTQTDDTYILRAACVLQGKLPPLSVQEITDLIRNDIEGFTEVYQPFETDATYYGGQPIYKNPFTSLLNGSFEANQQLIQLAKQEKQI